MEITFHPIASNTLTEVTAIYNYYVEHTTVTFHLAQVTEAEMAQSLSLGNVRYPSFLIKAGAEIIGFCYLSKFRPKQAYDITAEVTLYIKHTATQKGIGTTVLNFMEAEAKKLAVKNLIGVITANNTNSIKLFERNGYFKAALLKNVGIKFGKALDVSWYQKEI